VNHGPRTNAAAPSLLRRFFERAAAQTFRDLRLDDSPVQSYVAEILTRFARTEALYAVHQATSRRLTSVTDSLLAIEQTWDLDTPGFDPTGEISMRRHIGDYTLFMTGIFREHVERLAIGDYYEREGRRAYRFLAEMDRARGRADAAVFRRLAERFEQWTGALTYARKVYFREEHWRPGDPNVRAILAR
jgi:hypothetical protein